MTTPAPLARTPLHAWHAAHGGRFAERDGWLVVAGYADEGQEAEAGRTGLALADVSAFAKVSLRGPDVPAVVRALVLDGAALQPRSVAVVPPGPTLACRLTDNHLLLLAASPSSAPLEQQIWNVCDGRRVLRTEVTSALACFWLAGPHWEDLLGRLTDLDLRPASLPVNGCAETALSGVAALLVRAADGLRIAVDWDVGEYAWERLLEAGRDFQITPVGLDALSQKRRAQ